MPLSEQEAVLFVEAVVLLSDIGPAGDEVDLMKKNSAMVTLEIKLTKYMLVTIHDHSVSRVAPVHHFALPRRVGAVEEAEIPMLYFGRLTARNGLALGLTSGPNPVLGTKPRGVAPQNVSGIAVVSGQ